MDAPNLVALAICVAALLLAPRLLLHGVSHMSDGIAQLFVPPDRTLGWPRGVQESDDPWGWHEPATAWIGQAVGGGADAALERPEAAAPVVVEVTGVVTTEAGGLVVPVAPVRS
ncbi:MAG TPA: hypothetical protein VGO64_05300 [Candidatus Limnocylindrales bacterium]|jgi:hypothetical protein|nr:hypothetical protein [Candidatus Limnocylindrales bacterium]